MYTMLVRQNLNILTMGDQPSERSEYWTLEHTSFFRAFLRRLQQEIKQN